MDARRDLIVFQRKYLRPSEAAGFYTPPANCPEKLPYLPGFSLFYRIVLLAHKKVPAPAKGAPTSDAIQHSGIRSATPKIIEPVLDASRLDGPHQVSLIFSESRNITEFPGGSLSKSSKDGSAPAVSWCLHPLRSPRSASRTASFSAGPAPQEYWRP